MHDQDEWSNSRGPEGSLSDLIDRRLSRRTLLSGSLVSVGAMALPGLSGCAAPSSPGSESRAAGFDFAEIQRGMDPDMHVPEGYSAQVVLKWGDALFSDAPDFDPYAQTAQAQRQQFGYNCDFIGFLPLPANDAAAERGLLCVNHEYTSTALMFPGVASDFPASITKEICDVEMVAHGGSIVEVARVDGQWQAVQDSPFNRRIFGQGTPMDYAGPAAGSPRLAITSDPAGTQGTGTFNNCAGGVTAWGTYLMAEENFHGYFRGEMPAVHPETDNHARYGVPGGWFQWGKFFPEFDVSAEPNAPNRYGWVVEVDMLDPNAKPKKRTALGRFKHEGAESVIAADGRVVVYMGDDERFEYVYKFVTDGRYDANNRAANLDLLDSGTLYVARFAEDGTVEWLPLLFQQGPLTPANGFQSQADVVIEARRAADLLGATPMDRPEDVEAQPDTGRVYVMLTNNTRRQPDDLNVANPRPNNAFGHIVEITVPDGDHTATRATWEVLVLCGNPDDAEVGATWHADTSADGWFGSPDNCAFDGQGRLWVATDGNPVTGAADGIWAVETNGAERGRSQAFFRAPVGAEVCGPRFTPNSQTLFVAVQHPGDGRGATFETPTSRWPDFDDNIPPRPSVVAITRNDGGEIGG